MKLSERKVFLHGGKAYFAKPDARKFYVYQFEQNLREGLDYYSSVQHQFSDPRFADSLKYMTNIVGSHPFDNV